MTNAQNTDTARPQEEALAQAIKDAHENRPNHDAPTEHRIYGTATFRVDDKPSGFAFLQASTADPEIWADLERLNGPRDVLRRLEDLDHFVKTHGFWPNNYRFQERQALLAYLLERRVLFASDGKTRLLTWARERGLFPFFRVLDHGDDGSMVYLQEYAWPIAEADEGFWITRERFDWRGVIDYIRGLRDSIEDNGQSGAYPASMLQAFQWYLEKNRAILLSSLSRHPSSPAK